MLKNHLTIAVRNLWRQFGYAFLNIAGLAVGLACSLHIALFVLDELGYDRFHDNADHIYRVVLEGAFAGNEVRAPVTPAPMAGTLVSEFPDVVTATRMLTFTGQQPVRRDDRTFIEEGLYFVDSTFFDVFSFPLLRGNPETALDAPNTVILTETFARKYFGDDDPMGESLTIGDTTRYQITGVMADVPPNSHFRFDLLGSLSSLDMSRDQLWVNNNFAAYLVLRDGADPAALEAQLPEFFKRHAGPQIYEAMGIPYEEFEKAGNRLWYYLQPMLDIHLHSDMDYELGPNGSMTNVLVFALIAVFILALACINFMNLTTARSAGRAREVGVRKVLGSNRAQLIRQFLTESVLMSLVALVLAVGLAMALLPVFNTLTGKEITLAVFADARVVLALLALGVGVGVLAGSYPAFFLSAFRPAAILQGTLHGGGRRGWLRDGLVVFQFTISIALLIGTAIVYRQLAYIQDKDLGFDEEDLVVITRAQDLGEQSESFMQELRGLSRVTSVAGTFSMPGGGFGQTAYRAEGKDPNEMFIFSPFFADYDFADALGIEMAAGRGFDRAFATDTAAFIINEAAARALGWEDPIGKRLTQVDQGPESSFTAEIIGVYKDFHHTSLHQQIGALAVRVADGPFTQIAVRVEPGDEAGTLALIEETWKKFAPDQPLMATFLEDDLEELYAGEQNMGRIVVSFALFAVLIACLGLFGLASFTTEQRTKEIGIRKVLGATAGQVVLLLSREFTRLVGIAFVIAAPLAYFAMRSWLQDFAYRTSLVQGWWVFLLAGAAALVIAWLTVGYQAVRAARTNPVRALRYE